MEFNEKLQLLRKNKNLTQEELAEVLFVSRAAVSKWESGRGYPSLDSLKDISKFFGVSIDELLSGEKLLSIAEKENKSNTTKLCNMVFAVSDLFSVVLFIFPLYPCAVDGYVYSVSLSAYTEISSLNIAVYCVLFALLTLSGAMKLLLSVLKAETPSKITSIFSLAVGVLSVLLLALAREAYALVVVFLLLTVKVTAFVKGGNLLNGR